jgi:hypothetical protein
MVGFCKHTRKTVICHFEFIRLGTHQKSRKIEVVVKEMRTYYWVMVQDKWVVKGEEKPCSISSLCSAVGVEKGSWGTGLKC